MRWSTSCVGQIPTYEKQLVKFLLRTLVKFLLMKNSWSNTYFVRWSNSYLWKTVGQIPTSYVGQIPTNEKQLVKFLTFYLLVKFLLIRWSNSGVPSIYEKKWPYPQKIATNCFIVLNALGGHIEPQKKVLENPNLGKGLISRLTISGFPECGRPLSINPSKWACRMFIQTWERG